MKEIDPQWTQKYVAEKIGMARTTYTAYENGTKMPPADTINNIAMLLDVSNDYLMGRTEEMVQDQDDFSEQFEMIAVVYALNADGIGYTNEMIKGYYPALKSRMTNDHYVWLVVDNDDMIQTGIRKDSKVLIKLQAAIKNGDIAAVCIDQQPAVLKKVYESGQSIILVSENSSIADQTLAKSRVTIKGKAVFIATPLN